MKRTGIFGGSFNPIHKGHVALARYLCEAGWVDEVWLLVTPHNPLKPREGLLDEALRLEMARLAVADVPGVEASDFEFGLPRPSYSWRTLEALRTAFPQRSFSLIIGADNWQLFPQWRNHEDILRDYELIVYPRSGYDVDPAALPSGVRLVDAPLFPYSSTQVRAALQTGLYAEEMLPPVLIPFLQERGYYRNPATSSM